MAESTSELDKALSLIREVPNFPMPGVLFRDLGPVFADSSAFRTMVNGLVATLAEQVEVIVAIEARGFLLGAAVARTAGLGVVPIRKPGKSPLVAAQAEYVLEYGTATLELPANLLKPGQRVAIVDDVLATGGTAAAACQLVEHARAEVTGISVVIELSALAGRTALDHYVVNALMQG